MLQMRQFAVVQLLSWAAVISTASVTAFAQAASPTNPADMKLPLKAAIVLTPELCTSTTAQGSYWKLGKDTFFTGRVFCPGIEPALKGIFFDLTRIPDASSAGDAQLVLLPKFISVSEKIHWSTTEVVTQLEWTAKDPSGNTVWVATVEGHADRKQHKQVKDAFRASMNDLFAQSATKMSSSPELRKLAAATPVAESAQNTDQPATPGTATLLIQSTPGGAHVHVDGEPVRTTSMEGQLRVSALNPGPHRVLLSLHGFNDYSKEVEIAAGEVLNLRVKLEETPPSVMYIFRRPKFAASAYSPTVQCDAESVGEIGNGTYITVKVSPGKHVISSAGRALKSKNQDSVELEAISGASYYIELTVLYGPKITMVVVSKEIGESKMKKLKAGDSVSETDR